MIKIFSQPALARRGAIMLMAALLLCTLGACSSKDKAGSGQSLARVNGDEITVLQLNEELARNKVNPEQKDAASKKLLEGLIDRQLLLEAASKDKLDRDPNVVAAIERAKAQIIAQAYLQKRLELVARPTKEEIDKFYADHPDQFGQRKVFELDQMALRPADFTPEVKAFIAPGKSMDDLAAWLRDHHHDFNRNSVSRSTTELPEPLVKKLKEIRQGQLFALQDPNLITIAAIKSIKDDPARPEQVGPQIGNFMLNQRNQEATQSEITRLRAQAKIEYLNKSAATTADKPADTGKAAPADDHLKKGVSGL